MRRRRYRGLETAAIDALARDSIRFENACSHVPLTLPSHGVLLTGLLPFENGVRDTTRVSAWKLSGSLERTGKGLEAVRALRQGISQSSAETPSEQLPQACDDWPGF